jgi:flagellar hook protein FlgE
MSFQQGLSGLNATSKNLEVIGNNVANANTYGAKTSRAEFADMYASNIASTGTSNIGIGVRLAAVAQQFTQGSISATENPLDVAINGNGFFQLHDTTGAVVYSRNGQFKLDSNGYIVNNGGQKLMGYAADAQGVVIPRAASDLRLPTAGIDPHATDKVAMEMNLDSRNQPTLPAAGGINFNDPTTYNKATSLTAYDVKGQPVAMTYYFQKTAADTWDVYATANGTSVVDNGFGGAAPLTTLQFPTTGAAPTTPAAPFTFDIPATTLPDGSTTEPITGVSMDFTKATQYGALFSVTDVNQTGYAPGQITSLNIENNGIITARYSNGLTKSAGQLELASFRNPQGLQAMGGNAWTSTFASGTPIVGTAGSGNMGQLQSGALEESNVDLTSELVNMMTAQRVYQANAQTIKTEDSIMQTLVNLR